MHIKTNGQRYRGSFVDESSQCIALQSGEAGQEIEVIFDGVAELPGAAAGREITSPGVYGHCPRDGWLWVRPEWDGPVVGSYVGTVAQYNERTTNTITVGFRPSLLIVLYCGTGTYNGPCPTVIITRGQSFSQNIRAGGPLTVDWLPDGVKLTGTAEAAMNYAPNEYRFIALR